MYSLAARTTLRASAPGFTAARIGGARFVGGHGGGMHDNDPDVLEREKQRNLTGKQATSAPHAHAPGWNEHLASAAEAAVKADASTGSPADLVNATVERVTKRHAEIAEDRVDSAEAPYAADTIAGPLSGAPASADELPRVRNGTMKTTHVVKETIIEQKE